MADLMYTKSVERWGVLEIDCRGKMDGNPFTDYKIKGCFKHTNQSVEVEGFYDGEGHYKVRFMPSFEGEYTFLVSGSFSDETYTGTFEVTPATEGNHGPVRVNQTYHFAYEDGKPYYPVGTTCYVWNLQDEALQEKTLETLKKSAFNKIRFCVFPKHYDYNFNEPLTYPYEGTPMDSSVLTKENFFQYIGNAEGNNWDFERFNVAHFRHIEKCIEALGKLGIEADLIVMHPYDRWGFSSMSEEADDRYWQYVLARFSAYRNVWWSLANEYDLLRDKGLKDWERYAKIICDKDPYGHLRSIHNGGPFYDYSRPWITHCSIQRQDVYKAAEHVDEWRTRYKKPVVLDEIAYEGNIQHGWGNISGQELVRRYWEATCRGGYATHGETFMNTEDILWWSHGGALHGESPARIGFLRQIIEEVPGIGLAPMQLSWDDVCATLDGMTIPMPGGKPYYLVYYGFNRPSFRDYYFDDTTSYQVDVIDTWNMTITDAGVHSGRFRVELPGREYMAVRLRQVNS